MDKTIFPDGISKDFDLKTLQKLRTLGLDYENWSNRDKYYKAKLIINL